MEQESSSNRGAIVALIVVVVVVLGGLWLSARLRADNQIQDCVMSGRTNCAPLSMPKKG